VPTLRHLLAIEPGAIPDTVRVRLAERWGTREASEIGALSANDIEEELTAVLPDPEFDSLTRVKAAKALHRFLRTLGYSPENDPVPDFDTTPETLRKKSLRSLLMLLVLSPASRNEILTAINELPEIQAIEIKTNGRWIIPGSEVSIGIEQTLDYVNQMQEAHSLPQRMVDGVRPTTLNQAVGIDSRWLIHFFTGQAVAGVDRSGYDFDLLDSELHKALIWAAVTNHPAWPQDADYEGYLVQIFSEGATGRWALILDDYREAVAQGDSSVRGITRYWPMAMPLDETINFQIGIARSVELAQRRRRGSIDYEKVVREAAASNGVMTGGSGKDYRLCIYDRVGIDGTGNTFNGVVIVNGGTIRGIGNSGQIILPPDLQVEVQIEGSEKITIIRLEWQEIAEYLNLA
jgi:hypothetical protein